MAKEAHFDAQETFCEAVSILINKKIETIKFDQTIEVTIVDDADADNGKYIVTNGSSKFAAYSTETRYKNNDQVLITIPQGDFKNQKMIIGKKVDITDSPMVYISPFETLVDMTSNLIDEETHVQMQANYCRDEYLQNEITQSAQPSYIWDIETALFNKSQSYQETPLWESGNLAISGMTRLGLQAQFKTFLNAYNTVQGNYGLALEITFEYADVEASSGEKQLFKKIVTFDNTSFFGDSYNYMDYFTQEIVFNIEDFITCSIVHLRLFAYQRINFKELNGNYVPYDKPGEIGFRGPNIFIKDPYICCGTLIDEFKNDLATIVNESSSSSYYKTEKFDLIEDDNEFTELRNKETENKTFIYKKSSEQGNDGYEVYKGSSFISGLYKRVDREDYNSKIIALQWVHKDPETGIAKLIEEDEVPANYIIKWYRFKLGAKSPDPYAGAHWVRYCGINPEAYNNSKENYNFSLTEEDISNNKPDTATDKIHIRFQPDINLQEEQIKAIIFVNDNFDNEDTEEEIEPNLRLVARSNILTFKNDDQVRNNVSLIDENALAIRIDDDQHGNYFMYNRAGKLTADYKDELHVLTAVFDTDTTIDVYERPELVVEDCQSIKWIFPKENTMIIPASTADIKDAKGVQRLEEGHTFEVKTRQVGFFISDTLKRECNNNTVLLQIVKDHQNYEAEVQFLFGTAGSSGSDYTIVVQWKNGVNVLNASELDETTLRKNNELIDMGPSGQKPGISGRVLLLGPDYQFINLPAESNVRVDWHVALEKGAEVHTPEIESNTNIYYPIAPSDSYNTEENSVWVASDANSTVYYDPSQDKFKDTNNQEHTLKPYRQLKGNEQKYKFNFVEVEKSGLTNTSVFDEDAWVDWNRDREEPLFVKRKNRFVLDYYQGFEETETYYVAKTIDTYSNQANLLTLEKVQENNEETKNQFKIGIEATTQEDINNLMNSLYVLKVVIENFGDYNLEAYFPIPIKNGEQDLEISELGYQLIRKVNYIVGPTEVRYASSGEVDYDTAPYEISLATFVTKQNEQGYFVYNDLDVELNGYLEAGDDNKFLNGNKFQRGKWNLLTSKMISNEGNNSDWDNFYPELEEFDSSTNPTEDPNTHILCYDKPKLKPVSVYIKDTSVYGVQYKLNGQILWTQPILAYKDNYPSTTLNKWDGKSIQTDNDTGTIVANGLAAGKKESDNTFTGVVLGDWSRTDSDSFMTEQTGIYGFNHGETSYCLLDDGTAFFGKDGKGRIYINGNKSQIYSAKWKAKETFHEGMLLDLDDGYLKMNKNISGNFAAANIPTSYNYTGGNEKSGVANHFITLSSSADSWPLSIGTGANESLREFRIDWNGNGHFAGEIDAYGGHIGGWYIKEDFIGDRATTGDSRVWLSASERSIHATKGYIGGWQLTTSALKSTDGDITLDSGGHGTITVGSTSGNHVQLVGSEGSIFANKGTIGGWTLSGTSLISSDGKTELIANYGSGNPYSIKTPRVYIKEGALNAEIGIGQGYGYGGPTELIGIFSRSSLVLETGADKDIRLSGPKYESQEEPDQCRSINLWAQQININNQTLENFIKDIIDATYIQDIIDTDYISELGFD